jgi:predicted transcriptional regulator
MVILHGPKTVDKMAVDLAEREQIVLMLSSLPQEEDFSRLFKKM